MGPHELIRRGEQELARGDRAAAGKAFERARRQLVKVDDVEGLERLLEVADRLETPGNLTYAIRQNLSFLARRRDAGLAPLSGGVGRGTSVALGVAGACLAGMSGFLGLLGFGIGCYECTIPDGGWLVLGLVVSIVVGAGTLLAVLFVWHASRGLVGVNLTAAAGILVACIFNGLDGADVHKIQEGTVHVGHFDSLYWVWGLCVLLFVAGAIVGRRRRAEAASAGHRASGA